MTWHDRFTCKPPPENQGIDVTDIHIIIPISTWDGYAQDYYLDT